MTHYDTSGLNAHGLLWKESYELVFKVALSRWGRDAQTWLLFEEMAELQKAVIKNWRGKEGVDTIAEEIADVEIMLAQMKIAFGIEEQTNSFRHQKYMRLLQLCKEDGQNTE